MAVKPIISVEIDDHQFARFKETFNEWSDKVDEMPEHWRALNEIMGEGFLALGGSLEHISAHLSTIAAHSGAVTRSLSDAERAQTSFGAATTRAGSAMKGLAGEAKSVLTSVLQLGRLLGFGAGLAGIGGGLGIFALAQSATSQSRTAGGANVSPGQLNAFTANLGTIVGSPRGVLQSIADAQSNPQAWGALLNAGLSTQQIQGEAPNQLAIQALTNARQEYLRSHNTLGPAVQGALGLGYGTSDIFAAAHLSNSEFGKYTKGALSDAGKLGFSDDVASQWRNLDKTLKEAGLQIETTLIKGLAPLADPLARLSGQFTAMISSFITNDAPGAIKGLSEGLSWLSNYLAGPDFKKSLSDFGSAFNHIAADLTAGWQALEAAGLVPDGRKTGSHLDWHTMTQVPNAPGVEVNPLFQKPEDAARHLLHRIGQGPDSADINGFVPGETGYDVTTSRNYKKWKLAAHIMPVADALALENSSASANGVPLWFSQALFKREGGLNPDGSPRTSSAGALGAGQLMPGTAVALGVNPLDTRQNITGSTQLMAQLIRQFGGDYDKAAAAYNWGSGNLSGDIKKYGADWLKHAPDETRKYVEFEQAFRKAHPDGNGSPSYDALKRPEGLGMGDESRRSAGAAHFDPNNRGSVAEIVGAIKDLKQTIAARPQTIRVSNDTSARVHIQANAAGY